MKSAITIIFTIFLFGCNSNKGKQSEASNSDKKNPSPLSELLQGKWQHDEDKTNYLLFDGSYRKEIAEGMENWISEPYILSDKCVNELDKNSEAKLENDRYISCNESNLCWYIIEIDKENLSLSYMGRGNTLTYKRAKETTFHLQSYPGCMISQNTKYNVGIDFLNAYIENCNKKKEAVGVLEWVKASSIVTENFTRNLEKLLKDALKKEPEMGLGFDPVFNAQDYPEEGVQLLGFNPETGYLTAKGINWESFNVTIRIITKNGQELVDGCGAINISKDMLLEFSTIAKEGYSGATNKENLVITNKKDWEELWNKVYSIQFPKPKAPSIDFEKEIVIGVMAGEFSSGGYDIEIIELKKTAEEVDIEVKTRSPGPKCGVTSALTQPIHLVKITKTEELEFVFSETNHITNCSSNK